MLPAPREAVDTAALLRILEGLVEKSAQYHLDSGRLSREQLFEGEGILRRQAAILEAAPGAALGVQPQRFLFSAPMKKLHTHPAMTGIVHQLTGAAELCLTSNYALRSKAPSRPALDAGLADGGTVPWHQCAPPPTRRAHRAVLTQAGAQGRLLRAAGSAGHGGRDVLDAALLDEHAQR